MAEQKLLAKFRLKNSQGETSLEIKYVLIFVLILSKGMCQILEKKVFFSPRKFNTFEPIHFCSTIKTTKIGVEIVKQNSKAWTFLGKNKAFHIITLPIGNFIRLD